MIGEAIVEAIFGTIIEVLVWIFVVIIWDNLFNFIGGTFRWIYGTIWRTIARKPKYKFREYINGPDRKEDWFDNAHGWVNQIIGFLTIMILIIISVL